MGTISRREQEVLELLGDHLTHVEIADRLSLSVRTVESHAASLRRKLQLPDHRALVRHAVVNRPLPSGLPLPLTDFLGRVEELAELTSLLGRRRLVSVVGPGGVGKTRLVLEAIDRYGGRAQVVDLAPVPDETALEQAVGHATGAVLTRQRSSLDSVAAVLSGRATLLVLDNAEHLIDPVARWAEGLLQRCPDLRLVVTSRGRLAVTGEHVLRLAGLNEDDAAALFIERAGAAGAIDSLDPDRLRTICRAVDGLPLAIELAAVRLPAIGLQGIEDGLVDQPDLLSGGRTAVARHRSMQATLDWSIALLPPSTAAVLGGLSSFASPFDVEAVTDVLGADVRAHLALLQDQSLVTPVADGRLRLLEPVRQHAKAALPPGDAVAARHLGWVIKRLAGLAALADPAAALRQLDGDALAALDWARTSATERLPQLAVPYAMQLFRSGRLDESRVWFERGGDRPRAAAVAKLLVLGPEALRLELEAAAASSGRERAAALTRAVELATRFTGMFAAEVPSNQVREWLTSSTEAGPAAAVARAWVEDTDARLVAEESADPLLISSAYDKACGDLLLAGDIEQADQLSTRRLADLLNRYDEPAAALELKDALHVGVYCALAVQDIERATRLARRQAELPFLRAQRDVAEEELLIPSALAGAWDVVDEIAPRFLRDWERAGRPVAPGRGLSAASVALARGLRGDRAGRAEWLAVTATLRGVPIADATAGTGYGELFEAMVLLQDGESALASRVLERGLLCTGLYAQVFRRWTVELLSRARSASA